MGLVVVVVVGRDGHYVTVVPGLLGTINFHWQGNVFFLRTDILFVVEQK